MNLLSIQVGLPKVYGDPEKTSFEEKQWETGFFKLSVQGSVRATKLGLTGDGQADLRVHGGADKAICVYPQEHFDFWAREYGLAMRAGAFGENFTISGTTETEICVGDRYSLAGTVFEVSQPRQPCWKLARRWNMKQLPVYVQDSGRTGWYFRVVAEGEVSAPGVLELVERCNDDWTIARCNEVMYQEKGNLDAARRLSTVRGLSNSWRESLSKRASVSGTDMERSRLERGGGE